MYIQKNDNSIDLFSGKYNKKLVFRIGDSGGFYSEYNMMVFAIDFCLENNIRCELYSKDANFGYKNGWTDYFEPFCEEISEKIHSIINYRPKISGKVRYLWQLKYLFLQNTYSLIYKKIKGFDFYTQDIWNYINYDAKQLYANIYDKDIQKRYYQIIKSTWKYNLKTAHEINERIKELNLPDKYISLHIRRGDKTIEADYVSIEQYFNQLWEYKDLFILTDDYSIIEEIREKYPQYNLYTLCKPESRGYQNENFSLMNNINKKRTYAKFIFFHRNNK